MEIFAFCPGVSYICTVKLQEIYHAELEKLRVVHNYRTFIILSIILFASCALFLAQHILLPDTYSEPWIGQIYLYFYGISLAASLFFIVGLQIFRLARINWAVSATSLAFSLYCVTLGLALTVLDYHTYQNLTATYISTIGVTVMLSAPIWVYIVIVIYLLGAFILVYTQYLASISNPSIFISIFFLAIISAVFGIYTEGVRTKGELARLQMKDLMLRDPLTGAYNRLFINEYIAHSLQAKKRYHTDLSCLLLDVDFFKKINDRYGHQTGDLVLSELVATISRIVRSADIIARMGGEEFLIILPQTTLPSAIVVANKILTGINTVKLAGKEITVSIGIAEFTENEEFVSLYHRIDEALYKAKTNGRNRAEVSMARQVV